MSNIPVLSNLDFQHQSRILNLPLPQTGTEPATKDYVDSIIEGLNWKDNVRVVATSNIDLNTPPSSIDGVTLALNDRILLIGQTNQTQNGIYVYNGSGNPLTRANDADTGTEITNAVVLVDSGTVNAGTRWRCTSVNPNIGSDPIVFESFDVALPDASETIKGKIQIATQAEVDAGVDNTKAITPLKLANWAGRLRKYAVTFGDTTNTVYVITHNLNTRDITTAIYRTSDNVVVNAAITYTSLNTITIALASPPGNNALRVVVIG